MSAYTGSDLCALSAVEAVDQLRKGAISPRELLDAVFERIKVVEPAVNALPTLCRERALTDMDSRDFTETPLAGLPVSIKDLAAVKGVTTTYGTKGLADFIPETSDDVVLNIEAEGGVIYAKSNTPEMGAGGNTFNTVFGMTRNPWDTSRNAGGSSGGAAASLASGTSWLAHGSDLAGSLRTPAAYCGIVGLRPSPGRVIAGGAANHFETDGLQGPMARSVEDCALFLDAMAGYDPHYAISFPAPDESYLETVKQPIKPRIAYAPDLNGFDTNDPAVENHLNTVMATLAKDGATVDQACPDLSDLDPTYRAIRAMLWMQRPGRLPEEVQKHYKATLRENINYGRNLIIDDIIDARIARARFFDNTVRFLRDFDVLAFPVVGIMPTPVEIEYPTKINGKPVTDYIAWLRYSYLSTVTGLPAISVPVGFLDGMPVGLQLLGRHRDEAGLLRVAKFVEDVMGGPNAPIDPVIRHEV